MDYEDFKIKKNRYVRLQKILVKITIILNAVIHI